MSYVDEVYAKVAARDAGEPEFLQTVKEVLESLRPLIEKKEDRARFLAEKLDTTLVINGDAFDENLMEELNLKNK